MKPGFTGNWTAEISLAVVSLVWGVTFVLVKRALADISPTLFVTLRFSIATVVLAVVYLVRGGRLTQHGIAAGSLTGVALCAGYLLQTVGLRSTTPATSGFITAMYIAIVPVLSSLVYRKVPSPSEWLGVLCAFMGLGLLTLTSTRLSIGFGELLTFGCAVAFAVHILLLSQFSRRMATDSLALVQIGAGAAMSAGLFWWVEPVTIEWTPMLTVALLVTALLATAGAFWIQTWAQARTTPTRAALIFSLEPVFSWLTSWLVEGESLTGRALAGAACILLGILLVELKPIRTG